MPKKTKKAVFKTSGGVEYEIDGQYDFKQKYADWMSDCKGHSKEKIMSTGKKGNPIFEVTAFASFFKLF